MGLSQSQYLATANKMGALMQGSGFSIKESMEMSTTAMQRAADVASIMGIDIDSAMESIAGAAKGNFTMMDNLGVAINDTTIANYALSKGITKSTSDMTTQEKVGLAMELFMEKTAYAANNYSKENETLSGSLTTAKAAFENFLSGAGGADELAKSFTNAAKVIVKNLNELLPNLISGITSLINQLSPQIPTLLQNILPALVEGAKALVNGLVAALPAIIQAIVEILPSLLAALNEITAALIEALPIIIDSIVSFLANPGNTQLIVDAAITLFTALPLAIAKSLPGLIRAAENLIVGIITGLGNAVPDLLSKFGEILKSLLDAFLAFFGIHSPSTVMAEKAKFIVDGIVEGIKNLPEKAAEWFRKMKDKVVSIVGDIKSKLSEKFNSIKSDITSKIESIKSSVATKFNEIQSKMTAPIDKAKSLIQSGLNAIKGFFSNLKLSLPNIKLPHFKVSGKLSIDPPSVPHLSVQWYKKAYDNPMLLNNPTIFGYNPSTGSFLGGGDDPNKGAEVVSGAKTLMQMVSGAVSNETGILQFYLEKIMQMLAELVDGLPELLNIQLVADDGTIIAYYTPKIDEELGKINKQKDRGR